MSRPWRLIRHGPSGPGWNMAVDEALLHQAAQAQQIVLRVYQWCRPTVSLGYFQSSQGLKEHPLVRSGQVAVIRRPSGGGAIVHQHEWTYALAVPGTHPLAADHVELYYRVHRCWALVLAELGLNPSVVEEVPPSQGEPWLCFQRQGPADVIVPGSHGPVKLLGSAQRRRRGGVLQHGSMILDRPCWPDHPPALTQLVPSPLDPEALLQKWLEFLQQEFQITLQPDGLQPQEKQQALVLYHTRYLNPQWTWRR